ncbi:MAG: hypothetical protein AVDCRST_MAG12-3153 [uncultured Rubrobacteraceae bacterium]|uniref:Uncharacterized protein n=1 Tax=uncultured Rubrobacteraceae bacterium TaxID=349277 RepID=A0A6J4SZR4_9ACTN|nr:MAG: hypothetical protein AVDCRST_MAG12-3153 [uncultured Rubrobacteraceae bacterium]
MTKGGYVRANGFEMYYKVHGKVCDFLPEKRAEEATTAVGGPLGAWGRP